MSSMNEDDRLSRLPEEISTKILSLMPTKFAVRTSILSKRWRYSWMLITNLDFVELRIIYGFDIFSRFVERVLEFCKSSQVNLFRLRLPNSLVPESSVSKWIDKAVSLKVCELDIQLLITLQLPSSLLTCNSLTKLRIDCGSPCCTIWESLCMLNLPCLKILDIVVFTTSFVNPFEFYNGFPILESLSLGVTWCEDRDYLFYIPTLKRLKLTFTSGMPSFGKKVFLHVPNLEYLFVGGRLNYIFVMENVAFLVEATVSFEDLIFDHRWVELLKGLNGVKTLSIGYINFPYFGNTFIPTLPIFSNLKQLELKGFCYSGLIPRFLESSPELKHLCIEKLDVLEWFCKKYEEYIWIEPRLIPACMVTNLTTIKFLNCEGWKCEIEFLEYMLGNAEVLKTVTVTWDILSIEEKTRLCA